MSRTFSRLRLPCRYGKYELLERIGVGGMAEIFKARHVSFSGVEKIVVIKRLRPDNAAEPNMQAMFVDEAKLAADLHHRNIVQVHELGQAEDGGLFMAMEYIEGIDLKQLLKTAEKDGLSIEPWFSVWVMSEVLAALDYVHSLRTSDGRERNIVHRDVSPENIFISHQGDVKLGDFGVAKYEQRLTETGEGRIKGKLPYMSPEQIRNRTLDARTDTFAVAVVLWECLTQRRLFRGATAVDTLKAICYAQRRPPSELNPEIPRILDLAVVKALDPDLATRTPTARIFLEELVEILRIMRPVVHPSEIQAALSRFAQRRITLESLEGPFPGASASMDRLSSNESEITTDLI